MKKYFVLLIFVLLGALLTSQAQTKRALVIGIGEYEDVSWKKINGDKDVPYVLDFLRSANFDHIDTCVNEQATKEGVVKAFKKLTDECSRGDVIYIHFSGHGQQMSDINKDEADGWDEAWIPYDAYRMYCDKDNGEKHLTDDEIEMMLNLIKVRIGRKGKMLVVIDACHSGSATRDFGNSDDVVRGPGKGNQFVIPGISIISKKRKIDDKKQDWIKISACKDYQSNFEMSDKKVGKLTYAIWTILKDKSKLSNKEFEESIRKFMINNPNSRNLEQTPDLKDSNAADRVSDVLQ